MILGLHSCHIVINRCHFGSSRNLFLHFHMHASDDSALFTDKIHGQYIFNSCIFCKINVETSLEVVRS